jgi:hypothetical protein
VFDRTPASPGAVAVLATVGAAAMLRLVPMCLLSDGRTWCVRTLGAEMLALRLRGHSEALLREAQKAQKARSTESAEFLPGLRVSVRDGARVIAEYNAHACV